MEYLAGDLTEMKRTPLHDEHVAMIREHGEERVYEKGEVVADVGDRMTHFVYCVEGEIGQVDSRTDEDIEGPTIGPTQFLGEVAFLNGGSWGGRLRTRARTVCLLVERDKMLDLMAQVPEMSDIIVNVYAARRRLMFERQASAVTIIGEEESLELQLVSSFASRNKIPLRHLPLDSDEAREALKTAGIEQPRPTVIVGRDMVIDHPSPRGLARFAQ